MLIVGCTADDADDDAMTAEEGGQGTAGDDGEAPADAGDDDDDDDGDDGDDDDDDGDDDDDDGSTDDDTGPGNDAGTDGADDDDDHDDDDAGTDGGAALEECLALADAVEFEPSPPAGQTKVPGLGDCVELLDGETLWNYHCQWCHSTLDNNDIDDRTLDRIWWAVDFSEDVNNWPAGGLSDYPDAVERIRDAVVASPPPVADHPHPLPQYE